MRTGLLDQDPGDPQLETLQTRLEAVIRLAPQIAPTDKAARMAILGLKGFLALPPDHTLAHDALRYARELSREDDRYAKYLALLLALKRLGSLLAPNDKTLLQFVEKTRTYKNSAARP